VTPARNRVTPLGEIEALPGPDGAFVLLDEARAVVIGNRLREWTHE
jgi:hypothetical protein